MMVRGRIRDLWASLGREVGALGYPVLDEYRYRTVNPNSDPVVLWGLFENGAIVSTADGVAVARTAELSPEGLRTLVLRQFQMPSKNRPITSVFSRALRRRPFQIGASISGPVVCGHPRSFCTGSTTTVSPPTRISILPSKYGSA